VTLVPLHRWVLSLLYRFRYLLTRDDVLARTVFGVSVRVPLGFQPHRAHADTGFGDGQSGCVTVI